MCCQQPAKLMIMALEEYGYQSRRGIRVPKNRSSFEREIIDIDRLSRNIQEVKDVVLVKQKEYKSLRCSISKFTSSFGYFQQCEAQANARTNTASSNLMSKKKELARLLTIKEDTKRAQLKIKQSEVELKNNIATLKLKIEEENKKRKKDIPRY
nr:kinesin-like protein KIN-12E [Tanacetum cinerariifolium]